MTNEQLVCQYYDGDDAALEKLYHKNIGLIRGIGVQLPDNGVASSESVFRVYENDSGRSLRRGRRGASDTDSEQRI
jgi:hypothetical protein